MSYDASVDTRNHIRRIQSIGSNIVLPILSQRFENHDASKLKEPEKSGYDYYVPKLNAVDYGTPEYYNIREAMAKNCFKYHAQANSHHPEHYPDGVNDMDLFDLIEMTCDWFAASLVSSADFEEGLNINVDRFNIDPQLAGIIKNTYDRYLKGFKPKEETENE